jgi:hypothetical protein
MFLFKWFNLIDKKRLLEIYLLKLKDGTFYTLKRVLVSYKIFNFIIYELKIKLKYYYIHYLSNPTMIEDINRCRK